MPYVAVFLLLLALALLYLSARLRKSSGVPGGRIIYTDTRGWGPVEKPLYVSNLGLTGKPDYLVDSDDHKGTIIPVEVKSARIDHTPYDSHIYQLAAYAYLVEQVYGKRPPYGILHYSNRTFAVDYTKELETRLLELIAEMRSHNTRKSIERSHNSPARCARCGYRSICEQRI